MHRRTGHRPPPAPAATALSATAPCSRARAYVGWIVAIAVTLGACSVPEGDASAPEQAYYQLLNQRAAGDVDGLWSSLHPEVRREFERWHAAEQLALYEIRTAYPEGDKARALDALAQGARADLADARALFASVLTSTNAEPLGSIEAMAARVRSVDLDEETGLANVRTWGGDALVFERADGRWHWTITAAEFERLKAARATADENLRRVRANLKKLTRNP